MEGQELRRVLKSGHLGEHLMPQQEASVKCLPYQVSSAHGGLRASSVKKKLLNPILFPNLSFLSPKDIGSKEPKISRCIRRTCAVFPHCRPLSQELDLSSEEDKSIWKDVQGCPVT